MRRPEHEGPAALVFGSDRARKYDSSTRVREIQTKLTDRALELLSLPPEEPCLLLDIGCGSGLSSARLDEMGHTWIGTDISEDMLRITKQRELDYANDSDDDSDDIDAAADDDSGASSSNGTDDASAASSDDAHAPDGAKNKKKKSVTFEGAHVRGSTEPQHFSEVVLNDMGDGIPFRPGCFDGAVSISVLQWLCNAERKGQVPQRRLKVFFQSLYNSLRRGARAALQFYPENTDQLDMISTAAMRCGFGGGVVVDYPHSAKARKTYLVIYAGLATEGYKPPLPLGVEHAPAVDEDDDDDDDEFEAPRQKVKVVRNASRHSKNHEHASKKKRNEDGSFRPNVGTKEWVLMKKAERRSRAGAESVTDDTRYTMRKRRPRF